MPLIYVLLLLLVVVTLCTMFIDGFLWELKHYLFRFHYVRVRFGYSYYVRRLHKLPNGKEYIYIVGEMMFQEQFQVYDTNKSAHSERWYVLTK